MAAGPGTDVGDAALFLFTQTATERAHTGAQKQVCVHHRELNSSSQTGLRCVFFSVPQDAAGEGAR